MLLNAYADILEWIVRANGCQNILHYLDDFLVVVRPATDECSKYLEILISICTMLGIPLAEDKIEGTETRLIFLGIEIDSERQIASLPSTKLKMNYASGTPRKRRLEGSWRNCWGFIEFCLQSDSSGPLLSEENVRYIINC